MLVLARKVGQSIVINDNIELLVIEVRGDQVRIGIVTARLRSPISSTRPTKASAGSGSSPASRRFAGPCPAITPILGGFAIKPATSSSDNTLGSRARTGGSDERQRSDE